VHRPVVLICKPEDDGWRDTAAPLPLVDRTCTEILGLTAGTNTDIRTRDSTGAGSQEIRANGARSGDSNFMLIASSLQIFQLPAIKNLSICRQQSWVTYRYSDQQIEK
jgi:hypothetical protein